MSLFRALFTVSLLSVALADQVKRDSSEIATGLLPSAYCKNGVSFATLGTNFCCPGTFRDTDSDGGAYCCIGATDLPLPRYSDCYPNCGLTAPNYLAAPQPSCMTTAMVTDPAYSSIVNALGAGATTGAIPTATATSTESSSFDSTTAASTSGPESTSSTESSTTVLTGTRTTPTSAGTSATTSTSKSTGIAAHITGLPMTGALMLAGGLVIAAM